jgi:hypothetical protein
LIVSSDTFFSAEGVFIHEGREGTLRETFVNLSALGGYFQSSQHDQYDERRPQRCRRRDMMTGVVSAAMKRCGYSMMASDHIGGMICPKHPGQSGHPRPDSVTQTTPPSVISR